MIVLQEPAGLPSSGANTVSEQPAASPSADVPEPGQAGEQPAAAATAPAEAPSAPPVAGAAGSRDYVPSEGAVHCRCLMNTPDAML